MSRDTVSLQNNERFLQKQIYTSSLRPQKETRQPVKTNRHTALAGRIDVAYHSPSPPTILRMTVLISALDA